MRLISAAAFKAATPGPYRFRSGVAAIDKLVVSYEGLGGRPADFITRKPQLDALGNACGAYGGKRATGVAQLKQSIATEQTYVAPLAKAATGAQSGSDLKQAIRDLLQGQDAFLDAQRAGHPYDRHQEPDFSEFFKIVQLKLNDAGTRAKVMQDLILEDVQTLKTMAADPNVDPGLRHILNEVLANADQIYFQETQGKASGAVKTGPKDVAKGINEPYRVDVLVYQKEGSAERVSSLVHEMTHIAVQESFKNTAIHLAFKVGMKDSDVVALSQKRTNECQQLKAALDGAQQTFSQTQYSVLDEKVMYPVASAQNTLQSYADTFKKKGELSDTEHAWITGLVNAGANNTLTEFDTVVNQMLFLMTAWKIPPANPFYTVLRPIAADAHAFRQA